MAEAQPSTQLTSDEVRRVAKLARLQPSDAEVEHSRTDLATMLAYVALLQELNVDDVEPLTHPLRGPLAVNRLDIDESRPGLSIEALRLNAPAMEGPFVAVPKVFADADAAEGG